MDAPPSAQAHFAEGRPRRRLLRVLDEGPQQQHLCSDPAPRDRSLSPELGPRWRLVVARRFYSQASRESPAKNAGRWTRLKQYLSASRGPFRPRQLVI